MFKCTLCEYQSERTSIHYHHIIPRELGGTDKASNLVYLCPNCHNKVFVPDSNSGIHSFKNNNSIQIFGWLNSTVGRVLCYIDHNGLESFVPDMNSP